MASGALALASHADCGHALLWPRPWVAQADASAFSGT